MVFFDASVLAFLFEGRSFGSDTPTFRFGDNVTVLVFVNYFNVLNNGMSGCFAVFFLHDVSKFRFRRDHIAGSDDMEKLPIIAAEERMDAG